MIVTRCRATGKCLHLTAESARKQAAKDAAFLREPMDYYHCRACGGWHVGHQLAFTRRLRKALGQQANRWASHAG